MRKFLATIFEPTKLELENWAVKASPMNSNQIRTAWSKDKRKRSKKKGEEKKGKQVLQLQVGAAWSQNE